jgi:hypothetical protein
MNTPGELVFVHILRRPQQGTMKNDSCDPVVTQLWPLKQLVTLARKNESQPPTGGKKVVWNKMIFDFEKEVSWRYTQPHMKIETRKYQDGHLS